MQATESQSEAVAEKKEVNVPQSSEAQQPVASQSVAEEIQQLRQKTKEDKPNYFQV